MIDAAIKETADDPPFETEAVLIGRTKKHRKRSLKFKKSEDSDRIISYINSHSTYWKADVCKHSKNHPDYSHEQCKPKNNAQLIQMKDPSDQ
jgi:hypothetical protein